MSSMYADLSGVDQRSKKLWVQRGLHKGLSFCQNRYGIMAVQALLVTSDNAKITDPRVFVEYFAKKTRRVFNKNWIRGV